ncbi:MAG: terminase [Anaerolineae bacterium]|jgi:hypothetical protein|nr:terminase [Anaerolineae bacterium]
MARRWESKFLTALEESASVTAAAAAAGITRQNAYNHRRHDDSFAEKWSRALEIGIGTLEDEAVRRALEGVEEPIYQRGEYCGTINRYSDTLLIFLLKSHKPEVYNRPQRQEITGRDGGAVTIRIEGVIDDAGDGDE